MMTFLITAILSFTFALMMGRILAYCERDD